MAKTRRHVGVNLKMPMTYTTYRGLTGEQVTIKYLVNTGKVYANEGMGTNRRKRFSGVKSIEATMRLVRSLSG